MKLHEIVPLIPTLSLDTPNGALFSPDRSHRYLLWRTWLDTLEPGTLESWLMVMGLNPSKADEKRNDPTVSQMVGRGKRLGFTGLLMTNRHAHVSTDPRFLSTSDSEREQLNHNYILAAAKLASMIIFASGNQASNANYITAKILGLGKDVHVFGLTGSGKPRHPRGLALSVQPVIWRYSGLKGCVHAPSDDTKYEYSSSLIYADKECVNCGSLIEWKQGLWQKLDPIAAAVDAVIITRSL